MNLPKQGDLTRTEVDRGIVARGLNEGIKPVLIIQAHMGSTRLPGKVLIDIGGQTMLARVISRARRAQTVRTIVVATSTSVNDDGLVEHVRTQGVDVFRGDDQDVLGRFYEAATAFHAEVIVRITADCPLIEPEIIDKVVTAFLAVYPKADFAANTVQRTYPKGMDVEVASFAALECAWHQAEKSYQRAHVFPYIYENPDRFNLVSVTDEQDRAWMRWTVDTKEDLEFVRAVYSALGNDDNVSWREVLDLLDRQPELLAINRDVQHKALEAG